MVCVVLTSSVLYLQQFYEVEERRWLAQDFPLSIMATQLFEPKPSINLWSTNFVLSHKIQGYEAQPIHSLYLWLLLLSNEVLTFKDIYLSCIALSHLGIKEPELKSPPTTTPLPKSVTGDAGWAVIVPLILKAIVLSNNSISTWSSIVLTLPFTHVLLIKANWNHHPTWYH